MAFTWPPDSATVNACVSFPPTATVPAKLSVTTVAVGDVDRVDDESLPPHPVAAIVSAAASAMRFIS